MQMKLKLYIVMGVKLLLFYDRLVEMLEILHISKLN